MEYSIIPKRFGRKENNPLPSKEDNWIIRADMYTKSRDEEVKLLKRLWTSQPTMCPKCGNAELVHLHKKAKKSDCEWKCPACGEIYRTIHMLEKLLNK